MTTKCCKLILSRTFYVHVEWQVNMFKNHRKWKIIENCPTSSTQLWHNLSHKKIAEFRRKIIVKYLFQTINVKIFRMALENSESRFWISHTHSYPLPLLGNRQRFSNFFMHCSITTLVLILFFLKNCKVILLHLLVV